jgi:hypothetical protein
MKQQLVGLRVLQSANFLRLDTVCILIRHSILRSRNI